MPITPCFDPTTGASGGASGGGGGSLYDASMGSAVNLTDGSWTLYDPDSLVDSVNYSSGFNTVTMNALGSGSSHYRWDNTAGNNRAPRWYKEWFIDTTRIDSDDLTTHTNIIAIDRTVNDFNWTLCAGVCVNPATVTRNQIDGMGAGVSNNPGEGNARYGHWRNTSMPVTSVNVNMAKVVQVGQYGARHMGTSEFMALSAANIHLQRGATNGSDGLGAGVSLYQIVGLGTRTNSSTIGAGDQVKFSIFQSAIKWNLP